MSKSAKKSFHSPKVPKKGGQPKAASSSKHNSKTAAVLAMLSSKNGATIKEIMTSTGWQDHSVRGFLSGTIKKKLGHKIASESVRGERHYRITA